MAVWMVCAAQSNGARGGARKGGGQMEGAQGGRPPTSSLGSFMTM